jgi:hypothetical protein
MTWKEQLDKEVETLVKHGDGEIRISVNPLGGYKTLVKIEAGRAYRFNIDKILDD